MEMKECIHESLKKLQGLGIEGMKAEDAVTAWLHSIPDEVLEDMEKEQIIGMILCCIAKKYNAGQESAAIYSFDIECSEIGQMYTCFLQNIERIANGDLTITDIGEEMSEEVLKSGTGRKLVRFCCNGTTYEYDAKVNYDWFDTGILGFMNQVVKEQNTGSYLYVASDGYQECIVLYRTEEWARQFGQAFGVELGRPCHE